MIGLSGSLQAVGFQALTGFLGDLGKSGTLRITHREWSGEVVFDRGEVVGAALGAERGLAALDAIALALPEGEFAFVDAHPDWSPEREISLSPPALQARLDALLGQPSSGADVVPLTPATVPYVVQGEGAPGPALAPGQVALTRGAIQTLLAVDGQRTVAEIGAGRGLAETIKDLQSLIKQGLIGVPTAPVEPLPAGVQAAADADETAAPVELQASPAAQSTEAPPEAEPAPPVVLPRPESPATLQPPPVREEPAAPVATPAPVAPQAPVVPLVPVMPAPMAEQAAESCALLGFADDPANHFPRPTQLHRCFAGREAQRVGPDDQHDLCLGPGHTGCARFVAYRAAPRSVPDSLRPRDPVPVAGALAVQGVGGAASRVEAPTATPPAGEPRRGGGPNGRPAGNGAARFPGGGGNGSLEPETVPAGAAVVPGAPPPPASPGAPGGARVATVETGAAQGEETGTEAGAAAETAGDASERPLPPWLRQPRTQLVVGFLALAIIVALVAPLLLRPPENVTVRLDQATTPGAPTAAATPAATPRGLRTAYDDNFRSSQSAWPNNPESVAWFADGGYRLAARQPGQFVAIRAPIGAQFRDVVVQGTFRKVAGPAGGGYGLIVRDTGAGARDGVNQMGRFYVFEVGDKGEYGIWRRDGDKWVDILPWTAAPAVNAGNGSNTLNVQAIGTQLTFSINGQRVATQTDGTLQEGSVGIFVGGDGNEVVIERFAVQVPGT